jgi:hypothetical protein
MHTLLDADLLVLDDLFLARRIGDAGGELLQSRVHQRYKLKRSIVVTSNRVVQDWGKYWRQHYGDHHPRSPHASRAPAGVRRKKLPLEGSRSRLTGLVKQGESKIDPAAAA